MINPEDLHAALDEIDPSELAKIDIHVSSEENKRLNNGIMSVLTGSELSDTQLKRFLFELTRADDVEGAVNIFNSLYRDEQIDLEKHPELKKLSDESIVRLRKAFRKLTETNSNI